MKKFIVVTTINPITEAIVKMDNLEGWNLIVIGDRKTPGDFKLKNGYYMSCGEQDSKYPVLSHLLGWDNVDRRNIGFLEAYMQGADIVAMMDDDNIPKSNFGKNIHIGSVGEFNYYECNQLCFDPLFVLQKNMWHRGFPIELVSSRAVEPAKPGIIKPLVQADLWDDDPDVDAFYRMAYKPQVDFSNVGFFFSKTISPFNMQNTLVAREALKYLISLPFTGRMCDIWGAYYLQTVYPNCVLYGESTVIHTQKRTRESMRRDMEEEMLGYNQTLNLLKALKEYGPEILIKFISPRARLFITEYQKFF